MTAHQPAPAQPRDPGAENTTAIADLGRFPRGLAIWLALLAILAAVRLVTGRARTAVAECNGKAMAPGDTCDFRGRRGGRYTLTYDEVLNQSSLEIQAQTVGAVIALVALAAWLLLAILVWRRDAAVASTVATPAGLLAATADTTGVRTGFAALVGTAVALTVPMALTGPRSSTVLQVALGVVAIAFAVLVWFARPRGSSLLQATEQGVHAVVGGKHHDVTWTQARFDDSGIGSLTWDGNPGPKIDFDNIHTAAVFRERIAHG